MEQSLAYRFTFPPQQHHFDPGDTGDDPVEGGTRWTVTEIDNAAGTVVLKRGKACTRQAPSRRRSSPAARTTPRPQRAALRRLAGSMLAEDGRYPALRRLLRRDPPLGGAPVQRTDIAEQRALAVGLDQTYLFVQGPPGSGKTYRGARLITALIARREAGRASHRRATRRSTTCSTRSSGRPREERLDFGA